ncbi:hypothetical protein Aau02nite_02160 [Amorphoplanes auranticolor]|uniref:Uncharacterized protein n=1 Tax=Actinoplanes auranticolor TaxID=47988 RepID=A0A919VIN5_9ACTN|nr:hypothetical protein Aau02nite_02160 [Actinoplanes auranticolor]
MRVRAARRAGREDARRRGLRGGAGGCPYGFCQAARVNPHPALGELRDYLSAGRVYTRGEQVWLPTWAAEAAEGSFTR